MHGMGDCLHQRAVLRHWMKTHEVWLETSWAAMYHDLVAEGLHLVRKSTPLRTQSKNSIREIEKFGPNPPFNIGRIKVSYSGQNVRLSNSKTVLEAMCAATGTPFLDADYSLPVPEEWFEHWRKSSTYARWKESGKQLVIYRPLVMRPEWRGSGARNADPVSYAKLFAAIRDDVFVVSIADLVPTKEWIVGPKLIADAEFHEGQLTFETIAAMMSDSQFVYTSSGFAAILGPAVGTPTISVIGGYENTGAHDTGERFAPYLAFGPKVDCGCFSSGCPATCDKSVRLDVAIPALNRFVYAVRGLRADQRRPWEEMFTQPEETPHVHRARPFTHPLYNRGQKA